MREIKLGEYIRWGNMEKDRVAKLVVAFKELYDSSELLFKWYTDSSRRGRDLNLKIEYSPLNQQRLRHAIIKYGSLREKLT